MKTIIVLLTSLFIFSCQKEEVSVAKTIVPSVNYDFNSKSNSLKSGDDFSDLKKKGDESCDTEEEITKKLARPKQEAFKLQGGDTGCDIEGQEKGSH